MRKLDLKKRQTWLILVAIGIGLIPAFVLGLWGFMIATAVPLHTASHDVPSTPSPTTPAWATSADRARDAVRAAMVERNLPGVSVAVGTGGNIVWAEGFGWSDLNSHAKVDSETRFRIGTTSVALTSAAIGLLLEKNQLRLDDEVQAYVPEFPKKPWPITVRQLMAHTSGLRNDGGDEGPLLATECSRPTDALKLFADADLRFEPGTNYGFSSPGWIVLSAAVESAAHDSFLSFMRRSVFDPIGMRDTKPDTDQDNTSNSATAYFPRFAGDPKYGADLMRPLKYSCYSGASVFLSTSSDLVRFAMAVNSGKLLQPATVQMLQTTQRAAGKDTGYGLGWDLETVTLAGAPTPMIGHDGDSLGGLVSSLMTFPEYGLTVAVLSNTSYSHVDEIALKVAEAFAAQAKSGGAK